MEVLPTLLAALWAGALLGGSFVAAPAKFRTDLTVPQLLKVGWEQFHALAKAQMVLAVLLFGAVLWQRPELLWLAAIPVAIFAVQQVPLMPALDRRTRSRIEGENVPPSKLHLVFVVLEGAKFLGLLAVAVF
ncbi:MAG: hypothetical protein AAGA15_14050 [Pseudomonadota bacterium]